MNDAVIRQALDETDPLPKGKTRVHFIRFLRPNGRRTYIWTDLDNSMFKDVEEFTNKVKALFNKPIELSIEDTGMGTVYMSAEDGEFLYANAVAPNGPGIEEIVIKFVNEAYDNWKHGRFSLLEPEDD